MYMFSALLCAGLLGTAYYLDKKNAKKSASTAKEKNNETEKPSKSSSEDLVKTEGAYYKPLQHLSVLLKTYSNSNLKDPHFCSMYDALLDIRQNYFRNSFHSFGTLFFAINPETTKDEVPYLNVLLNHEQRLAALTEIIKLDETSGNIVLTNESVQKAVESQLQIIINDLKETHDTLGERLVNTSLEMLHNIDDTSIINNNLDMNELNDKSLDELIEIVDKKYGNDETKPISLSKEDPSDIFLN